MVHCGGERDGTLGERDGTLWGWYVVEGRGMVRCGDGTLWRGEGWYIVERKENVHVYTESSMNLEV